jgi:REP element-mobilizing transposase RayT
MTTFNPQKHHHRSIRLRGYDYTTPGAYFITLASWQRENIFGEILDGRIELNKFGQIAKQQWENLPCRFPHIDLDEFVIMPNHIHGIIIISTGGG